MEKAIDTNKVVLIGEVVKEPEFSHRIYGEGFYIILLGTLRRSGYEDRIRLVVSEYLLRGRSPRTGDVLEINGQIRTYNREIIGKNKLEIVVLAKTMEYIKMVSVKKGEISYENSVLLEGYICKSPLRRTSPLGREICDLMVAINRPYNKSDYVPTIAWGRNAMFCEMLKIGDKVAVEGRLQSREYKKSNENNEVVTKTAYEVSATKIALI